MLAINHVTLATAATLGLSLYFREPFFLPFLSFVVFASLLPDVDHPGSEISKFFPLINKALPHRGVTHSLVGTSLFGGGLYLLLGYNTILSLVLLLMGFIGVHYLGKLLDRRLKQLRKLSGNFFSNQQIKLMLQITSGVLNVFLLSLAFIIWKQRFRVEILILLVIGYFGHIMGDFITKDGIPLLWPIKGKQGLKLFRTGSNVEVMLGFVLLIANCYLLYEFWQQYNLSGADYWQSYLSLDGNEFQGLFNPAKDETLPQTQLEPIGETEPFVKMSPTDRPNEGLMLIGE